jgi:ferredoxin-NADP reductase
MRDPKWFKASFHLITSMENVEIANIENVGKDTIAVTLITPDGFEAYPGQFVIVRASNNGGTETGYYTISSPDVSETFEITVSVDSGRDVGPWLNRRSPGEKIPVEGPLGDTKYTGELDAFVIASGPGIGPAIGIAERAVAEGFEATIVYYDDDPPHGQRLRDLKRRGVGVFMGEGISKRLTGKELAGTKIFVFGFQSFVDEVKRTLGDTSLASSEIHAESFGPE